MNESSHPVLVVPFETWNCVVKHVMSHSGIRLEMHTLIMSAVVDTVMNVTVRRMCMCVGWI